MDPRYMYSPEETKEQFAEVAMLLRCCADGGAAFEDFGEQIDLVAFQLECSAFVTGLAHAWAQYVMTEWGRTFEIEKDVLLEAALRIES